jgi:hypothetical protein
MKKIFLSTAIIAATFSSCKKEDAGDANCGKITSSTPTYFSLPTYSEYANFDFTVKFNDGSIQTFHKEMESKYKYKVGDEYCR